MTVSRDTRTEQAIAYGRSIEWMLAHGYTREDIRRAAARMNAADHEDNASVAETRPTIPSAGRHWYVPEDLDGGYYCAACGLPERNGRHATRSA